MSHYLGIERLQLWFMTPNVCATLLVMTIVLSVGVFLVCRNWRRWWGYGLAALCAAMILVQQLMLAVTYSRGGYVAFAAGILLLWYLVRRRAVWIYGLTGLMAILLTANGAERVKSIAGVVSDASIGNRLHVWRGAAGIIQTNWFSGIEAPTQVYRAWYLPLSINEQYRTMVNDVLTLGANYGVGAFLLYLLIFFLPIWIAIRLCRAGFRPPWFAVLPAAIAGYFVAAVFSTMYEHDELFYFVVSLLGLTGLIEWVVLLRLREFRSWSLLTVPSGLAAGCGIALLLFGGWVNRSLPYITQSRQSQTIDSEEYHTLIAHPQGKSRGTIICLYSADNMEIIRSTVRPMLTQGYAVTVIEVDSGLNGVEHGRRVLAQLEFSSPAWLIGEGDGGKAALLLAAEMPEDKIAGVAVCNAPGNWPFKGLAPLAVIDRYPGPILLAVSDDTSGELLDEATQMAEIRRRHQLPVTQMQLTPPSAKLFHAVWQPKLLAWIEAQSQRSNAQEVVIFSREGCHYCEKLDQELRVLPPSVTSRLRIMRHDVMTTEGRTLYEAYRQLYGVAGSTMETPGVFSGASAWIGEEAPRKFAAYAANPEVLEQFTVTRHPQPEEIQEAERLMISRFQTVSVVAIAIAGLIDGINPCVFSALIFFISLLTVARVSSRQLLLVGFVYAAAYYVTYFAMGLGLVALWDFFNGLQWVGWVLTWGMIGVLIVLALLSLRDALRFKRSGSAQTVTLQLPEGLKRRIRAIMHRGLRYRYLVPGTFFIGVCVTLIESACTAQVYIPTAGVLAQYGAWTGRVLALLALYNLMCIVPLLTIFLLTYYGVTGRAWLRWSRRDVVWGKFLMSLLFLGLAVLLFFSR